jgi:acetyl-CoA synthetase
MASAANDEDAQRTKVTTPSATPMDVIRKTPHDNRVRPNLTEYEQARAQFHWSEVPALCEGMGPGRCNIAYTAVDRHLAGPTATRTAYGL